MRGPLSERICEGSVIAEYLICVPFGAVHEKLTVDGERT